MQVKGAKPLCLDCNKAGIINCSHFDNCDGTWVYVPTPQETNCAVCGELKPTPLRIDWLGGYVCLTCIDKELRNQREFKAGALGILERKFQQEFAEEFQRGFKAGLGAAAHQVVIHCERHVALAGRIVEKIMALVKYAREHKFRL
jgi:hypothetical protein